MNKFDCEKSCRMTCQIKDSDFCTKESYIDNSDIKYGCLSLLEKQPIEIRNHYKCDYWNAGLYDICKVCKLECIKNENEDLDKIKEQKNKLKKLMTNINPSMLGMPINPVQAQNLSNKFSQIDGIEGDSAFTQDAIDAASFASDILSSALSGKQIDLHYYKAASNSVINKVKNKTGNQNLKNPDFESSIKKNPYYSHIEAIKKNMKIK